MLKNVVGTAQGSPVYMHNVSSGMKNFLDRIAYWSHIFALRGKNAMVIASACPVVDKVNLLELQAFDDGKFDQHIAKLSGSLTVPS